MIWKIGMKFKWLDSGYIRTIKEVDDGYIYYDNPELYGAKRQTLRRMNECLRDDLIEIIHYSPIVADLLDVLN